MSITPWLDYDINCDPVMTQSTTAARSLPEWQQDVWPGFASYCDDCHNTATATDPLAAQAQQALGYDNEQQAYNQLRDRNFANSKTGALGSPAFWAARGERTDGRDNTLAKYTPNYGSQVWGYRFSTSTTACVTARASTPLAGPTH